MRDDRTPKNVLQINEQRQRSELERLKSQIWLMSLVIDQLSCSNSYSQTRDPYERRMITTKWVQLLRFLLMKTNHILKTNHIDFY